MEIKNIYDHKEIEKLINKYFEGDTTCEEERILKNYFTHEDIDSRLIQFKSLFTALDYVHNNSDIFPEDKNDHILDSSLKGERQRRTDRSVKLWVYVLSGIAACFVFLVLFFSDNVVSESSETYVMIDGIKYTDVIHIEEAFNNSIENVRIDMLDIFEDFEEFSFE